MRSFDSISFFFILVFVISQMFDTFMKNTTLLVKPGREGDEQRVKALEEQIQMLSAAASEAVDRANSLELDLDNMKNQETLNNNQGSFTSSHGSRGSSSSLNSLFSTASKSSVGTEIVAIDKADHDHKLGALIQAKEEALRALQEERSRRISCEKREVALRTQIAELKRNIEKIDSSSIQEKSSSEREERLHKLDVALLAIERARATLNSPRFFRYV